MPDQHETSFTQHKLAGIAISSTAALAFIGLFGLFVMLTQWQYHLAAAITMLVGTLALIGAAIALWNHFNRRRLKILEREKCEAQSAALEKSRLLATMSHEIRTPLNGIIGMVNLLRETGLTAEQQNYANLAHASSRTLLSIIDEILDHAKTDATRREAKVTDVRELIESVSELMAARAIGKTIDLSSYVSPQVPQKLDMDELALRQILFNLAGNAIKFTEQGSVAIELSCPSPSQLEIAVTDTGIGMTEAQQAGLFRAFSQAAPETARRFGGTGLGLSIVKAIVEKQGGHISVVSLPDKGSSFRVTLPIPNRVEQPQGQPLVGRNFILAMADSAARQHLKMSLEDLGATTRIITAENELAGTLRGKSVDPVVCCTGFAASLRRWKASRSRGMAPVWVIMKPEERRDCRDLIGPPFAGYLLKPLRHASLLARLVAGDSAALAATARKLQAAQPRVGKSSSLSVLVADDNQVNLLLARTILEKSGHKVTTAANGEEVLTILNSDESVDFLFLDVEMPRMDGLQTARAIRKMEHRRNLPVIGLTAHARAEELRKCLAAGMNDHLAKPFDNEDLAEIMAKHLKKAAA